MVVAGTDAAAVVLPHLARQLISLHAQRADVAAQIETLVQAHPHVPGPDLHARDQGSRPPPSSWPRPWVRTSRHRRPAGLLRRARSRHTPLRLIDPWRGASPTAATRGSSAPCSCPPSPPCAPTPSPGPTTSANETKANRLGPGRPRPGPPPHPDPARHDPRWSPLRPTTSHETTRRRLTHHRDSRPTARSSAPIARPGRLLGLRPPQHLRDLTPPSPTHMATSHTTAAVQIRPSVTLLTNHPDQYT